MEDPVRQDDDVLLEDALSFLDPEWEGRTTLERILDFDFRPLERLLSQGRPPVSDDLARNLMRLHQMERLRALLLPYLSQDGPLVRELTRVSIIAANPYRKCVLPPGSPGVSSAI